MFKKKEKVEITPGEPQFSVKYIGRVETFIPGGRGCTRLPVQKIWDNSVEERRMTRMSMLISQNGIHLSDAETKKDMKFTIHQISYCSAEQGIHDRVFSWIYKENKNAKMECHAVLCSSKESAQAVSVMLSRAFQVAYKDWKHGKEKLARLKERSKNHAAPGTRLTGPDSAMSELNINGASPDLVANGMDLVAMGTGLSHMNITEEDNASFSDNNVIMNYEVEKCLNKEAKVKQLINH